MQLAIAATLLVLLCSVIVELFEGKKRAAVEALLAEAKRLRREAKLLTSPSNFAQSAKLQRAAAAKEKEAAEALGAVSGGRAATVRKAAATVRDLLSAALLLGHLWRPVLVVPPPGLGAGFDLLLGLGSGYRPGAGAGAAAAGAGGVAAGTFAYLWLLNRAGRPLGRLVAAGVERVLDSKVGCAASIAMED